MRRITAALALAIAPSLAWGQATEVTDAAGQLAGPVGVIMAALIVAVIGGLSAAVGVLYRRTNHQADQILEIARDALASLNDNTTVLESLRERVPLDLVSRFDLIVKEMHARHDRLLDKIDNIRPPK